MISMFEFPEGVTRSTSSRYALFRDGKGGLSLDPFDFRIKEDKDTGMPVSLAENEYFRVSSHIIDTVSFLEVRVSYMKRRWWWFDIALEHSSLYLGPDNSPCTKDDILRLAVCVTAWRMEKLEEAEKKTIETQREEAEARKIKELRKKHFKFDGDYPPKVLK